MFQCRGYGVGNLLEHNVCQFRIVLMSTHIETHMQHIKAGIKWQNMFGIDKK